MQDRTWSGVEPYPPISDLIWERERERAQNAKCVWKIPYCKQWGAVFCWSLIWKNDERESEKEQRQRTFHAGNLETAIFFLILFFLLIPSVILINIYYGVWDSRLRVCVITWLTGSCGIRTTAFFFYILIIYGEKLLLLLLSLFNNFFLKVME